jgi:hypothetical protein
VDHDGAVAKRIVGVSVGGQEPASRLPPSTPLRLGEASRLQVVASVEQPLAAADDTDPPLRDAGIHERQPGGEHV